MKYTYIFQQFIKTISFGVSIFTDKITPSEAEIFQNLKKELDQETKQMKS